ncbi:hypothetical protein [Janthinobacterium sp. PC23-8]|uniref:hypothetical protein n=1 Tax=Janthinobacterium sp. PC23-8 TaxID=2012679 RepID=UPI000B97535A|nr:hypothetical protein [Janthinobacterium sp. PC23-8]OYO25883.1 hypothetical protein CD932_27785 [Janthinobacterium sp. PC23-8]
MIKKKNNTYKHIKDNIAKLTLIQQVTSISPETLTAIFLSTVEEENLHIRKKTQQGYWNWDLADKTAYKYFGRQSAKYRREMQSNYSFILMLEFLKSAYLSKEYFGYNYNELIADYRNEEAILKKFVRKAFIEVHPITPGMSPKEKALRNQRLGKISVEHWIGDIVHYDYFNQAPGFMMEKVICAIYAIKLYATNILNDKQLDIDIMKIKTNQRLEIKLQPKPQVAKKKVIKI